MLGIYELLYAMYMSQYTYVLRSVEKWKKLFLGLSRQQGWRDSHHGTLRKWLLR